MAVGAVNSGLDSSLALNTWSGNLTGITNQFVRFFFSNAEVDFFYAGFVCVSQRILWQNICFWRIVRYHMRLSCSDFDNLRHWSESFLIGQLLAVNFLTIGTIDAGLDSPLALNARCCDLASISNKFVRFFFSNCEVDFFYSSFVCESQWILWQRICFWRITWYHGWLSSSDFNNLCYWSQGFFIGQLLAVDLLTIGSVNTGLDCSLALHTWSRDLTGITN